MVIPILLFVIGLVCLIKGGDWFVDGATGLARRVHMSELLIGATVVSIGTTIPEVMVSATAAVQGSSAISYGNAIGSVICNTALIAALTPAIRPCAIDCRAIRMPVLFFFGAAVFYAACACFFQGFSRVVGLILMATFVVYILLSVKKAKVSVASPVENSEPEEKTIPLYKILLQLIVGAAVIAVGANLLVNNGTKIAEAMGVPESVIALTMVALGTSLPELVTAITSLAKGHSALSLGNIIGANLFNLVLVSGIAITIRPFSLAEAVGKTIGGINSSLLIDIPLMFIVMLILCLPAVKKGKLYRTQGIALLLIYIAYLVFQFCL